MLYALAFLLGCADKAVEIHDRVVAAGCAACVFEDPAAKGCYWAVKIDGKVYPAAGEIPSNDQALAHEPGGMCLGERQARVDGKILEDGRFLASRFELLPEDGTTPPAPGGHAH